MRMTLNPVLKRELTTFQRGWKLPVGVFLFNILFLVILFFYQLISHLDPSNAGINLDGLKMVYYAFIYCELILILLIVPAVTSSSISGERQRGTLDILLVSAKSYRQIIIGKLFSGILIVGLIVISSLPFYALIGIYGGVGIKEMAMNIVFYLIIALFYGALGLMNSVLFNKNNVAIIVSYLAMFANSALTFVITGMVGAYYAASMGTGSVSQAVGCTLYINPFVFTMTMMDVQLGSNVNILSGFKNYVPMVTLIIMVAVHVVLTLCFTFVASKRLKSRG